MLLAYPHVYHRILIHFFNNTLLYQAHGASLTLLTQTKVFAKLQRAMPARAGHLTVMFQVIWSNAVAQVFSKPIIVANRTMMLVGANT